MTSRLAVVGLGLMGGSLGLAARERAGWDVAGYDPDPAARAAASERGCVASVHAELAGALAGAELVVCCSPIGELPATVAEALAGAPDATVTDIGSTKAAVVASVAKADRGRFIGGHPLAGREVRGAQHAVNDLFTGATWFLTPTADTDTRRYRDLHAFVASLGAEPIAVDPGAHDRLLALTSHLPHVIANLLVNQAGAGRIDGHDPLAASGGSFRDMTRVAGANPRIWVDIFLDNREALAAAIREHQRLSAEVLAALDSGDAGFLARWIAQASGHRRRALEVAYERHPDEMMRVDAHIPDRPGAISGITQALGAARINIEDFELHHFTPDRGGTVSIVIAGNAAARETVAILEAQGYSAMATPLAGDGGSGA
jgi:prephenate dehydrogenase